MRRGVYWLAISISLMVFNACGGGLFDTTTGPSSESSHQSTSVPVTHDLNGSAAADMASFTLRFSKMSDAESIPTALDQSPQPANPIVRPWPGVDGDASQEPTGDSPMTDQWNYVFADAGRQTFVLASVPRSLVDGPDLKSMTIKF